MLLQPETEDQPRQDGEAGRPDRDEIALQARPADVLPLEGLTHGALITAAPPRTAPRCEGGPRKFGGESRAADFLAARNAGKMTLVHDTVPSPRSCVVACDLDPL